MNRVRERFLVHEFQKGNADAFLKLVQAYERRLLYFLRRFEQNPDRALDALQEVWLSAWKQRTSLRSPDAFRVWLYRIAHGKVVAAIRNEVYHRRVAEQHAQTALPVSEDASEILASAELVHFALSQISPDHREILTLRFLEELSVPEIALIVGCPEGTVKSRLHYASQQLTSILKGESNGDK